MIGRLDAIPLNRQWLSSVLVGAFFYGMVSIMVPIYSAISTNEDIFLLDLDVTKLLQL